MIYTTITNNPTERQNITYPWVYWDDAFSEEELQKMCVYFKQHGLERGKTSGDQLKLSNIEISTLDNVEINFKSDKEYRKSNVMFHNRNENTAWIYDRMNWVIQQINEQFYGFDLYGYDTMQYTEYESFENGKYDFHMDTMLGDESMHLGHMGCRKLSLTMSLNEPGVDFEGGDFQINRSLEVDAQNIEMKKGRIIAFPSFMLHRVAPVTSGKRKSLVIWVLGPKFK